MRIEYYTNISLLALKHFLVDCFLACVIVITVCNGNVGTCFVMLIYLIVLFSIFVEEVCKLPPGQLNRFLNDRNFAAKYVWDLETAFRRYVLLKISVDLPF